MMLTVLAWIVALALALPLAVFTTEIAVGLKTSARRDAADTSGNVAVLIPAHDEAGGIAETLAALQAVAGPSVSTLVVADNCSDATATIARACGADVIERQDTVDRGKGFALAFGRDHLAQSATPPAVVVVLDADCRLAPGSIAALRTACLAQPPRPAQAVNLIAPALDAPPMTQIGGFAMVVKNLYRSRGMQRMGGAALLTGTGMAFPWALFERAALASGALAEDLGLGIELTRAGHPPRLIEGAAVSSAPAPPEVALVQKTRWEHGFLDTVRGQALPLLAAGLRRGKRAEVLLALHLLVPPLALLLVMAGAGLGVTALLFAIGADGAPSLLLGAMLLAALIVTFVAWLHGGRRWLSGGALLRAPLYVLWKLPIYLRFLKGPETVWQRTKRAGE
ncbi:glycosyltransferase family 2 protein [Sphingomonas sp. RS2018]